MILEKIISDCKLEKIQAQKSLYLFSYKLLYATALRYVQFDDQAKDVLQNSYIKIFKNLKAFNFNSEATTMAWMKRICINEALQLIRKKKTWNKNLMTSSDFTIGNNHQLFKDELYAVLLKLPEQQRIIFSLFAIEGYSHKEIAERLNIGESNSRTIVSRARRFLASHITNEMIHESA